MDFAVRSSVCGADDAEIQLYFDRKFCDAIGDAPVPYFHLLWSPADETRYFDQHLCSAGQTGQGNCGGFSQCGKGECGLYNWETMRHVWSSETMKYTFYLDAYSEENTDAVLTMQMLELLKRKEPDFLYLYMVETDDKGGHDHGWMSKEYLAQTANAIDCVEKVFQIASEHYNIIVTADHGGHDRTHGTDCAEDMTIPMFFWGDGFAQGVQMENISLLDIAPTVASLMGVAPEKEWEGRALKTVM